MWGLYSSPNCPPARDDRWKSARMYGKTVLLGRVNKKRRKKLILSPPIDSTFIIKAVRALFSVFWEGILWKPFRRMNAGKMDKWVHADYEIRWWMRNWSLVRGSIPSSAQNKKTVTCATALHTIRRRQQGANSYKSSFSSIITKFKTTSPAFRATSPIRGGRANQPAAATNP